MSLYDPLDVSDEALEARRLAEFRPAELTMEEAAEAIGRELRPDLSEDQLKASARRIAESIRNEDPNRD